MKNFLTKLELYCRANGYFEFADWVRQYAEWKETKVNKYATSNFPKMPWRR
jgi:hypothetical protein